jgi:hypothetical protein
MINIKDSTKILNSGSNKFSSEDIVEIRDFLYALAQIEFENYLIETNKSDKSE